LGTAASLVAFGGGAILSIVAIHFRDRRKECQAVLLADYDGMPNAAASA
jgi:hypothetical protein